MSRAFKHSPRLTTHTSPAPRPFVMRFFAMRFFAMRLFVMRLFALILLLVASSAARVSAQQPAPVVVKSDSTHAAPTPATDRRETHVNTADT
ncbi:MAG: hypothetical protein WCD76_21095, partial [Pyrinomonadaceae bacterium]